MNLRNRLSKLPLALLGLAVVSCGGGGSSSGGGALHSETIVAANFPTTVRFSPDGRLFFAEKNTGKIFVVIGGVSQLFATLSVGTAGEQGLLGLAFDPDFGSNGFLYAFYSKADGVTQEVIRFTDSSNVGTNPTPIVTGLTAATNHNGGRIAFGSDGKLYVTLGENGDPANSQNNSVPTGKVLRYNPDGSIPADNPIPGNPMFTKGHRNCFGLCVDPASGALFVSENGPNCDDEINRLVSGSNYGWRPAQPCGDTDPSYVAPIQVFSSVIAPTGITVGSGDFAGSLLLGCVGDRKLRQLPFGDLATGLPNGVQAIYTDPNLIIDVTMGPDGNVYLATADGGAGGAIVRLVN